MKVASLGIVIGVLLMAGCSSTSSQYAANSAAEGSENSDGLICRLEKPTGSNRPKRICMSAADAQKLKEYSQRQADRWRNAETPSIQRN
ncbi:hypothetical protein [Gallaecimonas xiamenensis]|uniref:hypothetical protein n=1 Tax=Gallaecimonas xiamenensis TaxID=1207039 RepID=UPI0012E99A89|nr:hypothetical protein [Gallaecimonas xiamenensis]